MARRSSSVTLLPVLSVTLACARGEPPSFRGDGAVAPIDSSPSVLSSPPSVAPASSASPLVSPSASPFASALPLPATVGGSATDAEQTRDKPSSRGAAFESRARALWDAIAADKPELGRPMFFPMSAYEKVKAVQNPAADWRRRLVAAYDRDIGDLHVALGERASRAKFVALEVPDDRGVWVEPGEEYNKLGYYRVFGSRLKYEVDGRERSFLVKSLISWRGEWYVVHLSAMK